MLDTTHTIPNVTRTHDNDAGIPQLDPHRPQLSHYHLTPADAPIHANTQHWSRVTNVNVPHALC